jgi:DNA-binding MarR family transcriptional regulator
VAEVTVCEQLSAAFVAFAIEADDVAEARIAHTTTRHGQTGEGERVWLTSLAMWFGCLRWLTPDGITVAQLRERARMGTNLAGMRRWGYLRVEPTPRRPGAFTDTMVLTPTRRGGAAAAVWAQLPGEIEDRWRERRGAEAHERLRAALIAVTSRAEIELPDYLPVVGHGLFADPSRDARHPRDPVDSRNDSELSIVSLLARVLLLLVDDYEADARLSLAVQLNGLAALADGPAPRRELPARTGLTADGVDRVLAVLQRTGCVTEEPLPGRARGRQISPTERGQRARAAGAARLDRIEARLGERYGKGRVTELRRALAPLGDGTREGSSILFAGLQPSPGSWRTEMKPRERLPRFPLVTHRGGYADGS